MKIDPNIDTAPLVAALKPLQKVHGTLYGDRVGFFMADAVRALGSLAKASEAVLALDLAGLLTSEPVIIEGDDAHTLFRFTEARPGAASRWRVNHLGGDTNEWPGGPTDPRKAH